MEDLARNGQITLTAIGELARQRFGKELAALNRLEASGLIGELLETYGERRPTARRGYQPRQSAATGARRAS
jgi:hypothetical protein